MTQFDKIFESVLDQLCKSEPTVDKSELRDTLIMCLQQVAGSADERLWKRQKIIADLVTRLNSEGMDIVIIPPNLLRAECDCGSKHTSHPEHHSDWCSTVVPFEFNDQDEQMELF